MHRLWGYLKKSDEIFAGTCLLVTVLCTSVNVFTRYILNYSIPWSQEISLTAFCWSIMIGMSSAYRHNMHYGIDLFVTMLPHKYSRILRVITYVVMFVGCCALTWFSIIITKEGWFKLTSYFMMPYAYKYMSAVVGFALMAIYSIRYIIFAFKDPEKFFIAVEQGGSGLATDFAALEAEAEAVAKAMAEAEAEAERLEG